MQPEKKWLLGMFVAHSIENKPNVLLCWVTGEYVKVMEALPGDTVFHHTVENLQRFLGSNYNVGIPSRMLRTQWFANPHFRGAYSFRSMDSEKRGALASKIAEPLPSENPVRVNE